MSGRSGFVPVVGRPNVGKSTLVNTLVGHKVAITSTRPQTTRNTIRGVLTLSDPDRQFVFVDTPGLHRPRTALGKRLNRLVYGSLAESDVVVFLLDATQKIGPGDRLIAERLTDAGGEVVVAVNKVDVASKIEVVAQLAEAGGWGFAAYVPVSALLATGLPALLAELEERLPEGPQYFPADVHSDQPERLLAAELIREKYLDRLQEELPHSVAVVVEDIETRDKRRCLRGCGRVRRARFAKGHRDRQRRFDDSRGRIPGARGSRSPIRRRCLRRSPGARGEGLAAAGPGVGSTRLLADPRRKT